MIMAPVMMANTRWSGSAGKKSARFVRALEGTYSDLTQSLLNQPRVYSSRDMPWKGGPQVYGKHVISPHTAAVAQSIETHIEIYAPGAYGQKHGHMNSAVFYVLKGRGHDIHDERRIDWKAGDIMLVENGCVHQHFTMIPTTTPISWSSRPAALPVHCTFYFRRSYRFRRPPCRLATKILLHRPICDRYPTGTCDYEFSART